MRALLLLVLSGCSWFFGLDEPRRQDAGAKTDSRPIDAAIDTRIDAPPNAPLLCTDNFNDNLLDSRWIVVDMAGGNEVREQNQRLEIVLGPDIEAYSGIRYGLTGEQQALYVEFVQVPNNPRTEAWFGVFNDGNNHALFIYSNSTLIMRIRNNGTDSPTSFAFDANAHRYWRITTGGTPATVTFDVSGNGVNYTAVHSGQLGFSVDASYVDLIAGSFNQGSPDPGLAAFDNFVISSSACML